MVRIFAVAIRNISHMTIRPTYRLFEDDANNPESGDTLFEYLDTTWDFDGTQELVSSEIVKTGGR